MNPAERFFADKTFESFDTEREFAERDYNVVQWTDMQRGGHFPALEQPTLLVDDIRRFFARFRQS